MIIRDSNNEELIASEQKILSLSMENQQLIQKIDDFKLELKS